MVGVILMLSQNIVGVILTLLLRSLYKISFQAKALFLIIPIKQNTHHL